MEPKELTLEGALSDPLIRSLMAADKVDPATLETMLLRIAAEVEPGPSATRSGCGCSA
jgi:hypothetical protein